MQINCFSFFLLLLLALKALGEPIQPISLTNVNQKINLTGKAYYLTTPAEVTVEEVVTKVTLGRDLSVFEKVNQGYTAHIFWLAIPVKNDLKEKQSVLLEIANPHIDYVQAYWLSDKNVVPFGKETGDNVSFDTRSFNHRNFIWPIEGRGETASWIILRIDKRNSSLLIPVSLWSTSAFVAQETRNDLFYGICFGMMLLVAAYSLFSGLLLQSKIELLYSLFVFTAILFLATGEGFSFQYLYPSSINFNSLFRVLTTGFSSISLILFSKTFLHLKKYSPGSNRVLNYVLVALLALALLTPFLAAFYFKNSKIFVPLILGHTLVANLACLTGALYSVKFQRQTAIFYLIAYFITFVAGALVVMEDLGWIEKLSLNPLFIGALMEIIVFSLGISFQIKKAVDERNLFATKISKHQNEMMKAYIQGIEKERQRIAGDLHDDIGSRLSNLRRMSSNTQVKQEYIESQIATLSDDIRNLSHQLATPGGHLKGLPQLISELIASFNNPKTKFSFQYYDIPEKIPEDIVQQIYRVVQEACNNIFKHSKASNADIQLFYHGKELVITIEDDGQGFNIQSSSNGLGFTQMHARVESVQGQLEISSQPMKGTLLAISIPFA